MLAENEYASLLYFIYETHRTGYICHFCHIVGNSQSLQISAELVLVFDS